MPSAGPRVPSPMMMPMAKSFAVSGSIAGFERLTSEGNDLFLRGARKLVVRGVLFYRRRNEHERQHGEYDGLHESDEYLEE